MSKNIMQMCADEIAGYLKRIADLEAKLAQKEKLINDYADDLAMLQCKIADLAVKEIKAEKFAIEQLEKVKEVLKIRIIETENMIKIVTDFEFQNKLQGVMKGFMDSIVEIDQQIQELRRQE